MKKYGFSWNRALGITGAKQRFARKTGIPTTKQGFRRKIDSSISRIILNLIFGKK